MQMTTKEANASFNAELLKLLLDDTEQDDNDVCLIDGLSLDSNAVTLTCSHRFNYTSLLKEVKKQLCPPPALEVQKLKRYQIKCPYCRKIHKGVLPYISGLYAKKIRGVNWPPCRTLKTGRCVAILRSGKRKGHKCLKSCHAKFCKTHLSRALPMPVHQTSAAAAGSNNIKLSSVPGKCGAQLKSGKRKGQVCGCRSKKGSSFCGRHIPKVKNSLSVK